MMKNHQDRLRHLDQSELKAVSLQPSRLRQPSLFTTITNNIRSRTSQGLIHRPDLQEILATRVMETINLRVSRTTLILLMTCFSLPKDINFFRRKITLVHSH